MKAGNATMACNSRHTGLSPRCNCLTLCYSKERKARELREHQEELKRLKNMQMQELRSQMKEVQKTAGVNGVSSLSLQQRATRWHTSTASC